MNSDLYFDGKKYISSSRAAKISGYVNDYIGQLCRDGKLESRMVGRSWYVSLDSLIAHKNAYGAVSKTRGSAKVKNVSYLSPLLVSSVQDVAPPVLSIHEQVLKAKPGMADVSSVAEEALGSNLLVLSQVQDQSQILNISPIEVHDELEQIKPEVVAPAVVHASALPAFAEAVIPEYTKSDVRTVFAKSAPSKLDFGGANIVKFAGVFVAIFVLLTGFKLGIAMNPQAHEWYRAQGEKVSASLQANVLDVFKNIVNHSALAFYDEVEKLVFHKTSSVLVSNVPSGVSGDNTNTNDNAVQPGGSAQGMVVVPTDAGTDRAGVVQKIENSFSDEVSVKPGDDQSGVITPVFKNTKSDDYLYVLVPLK